MTFYPKSVEVKCVTLPMDHGVQVPWKYIKRITQKYLDTVSDPLFFKKKVKVSPKFIDP